MNNDEMKKTTLTSRDFEFVQAEQKIYDKKFETKPIGYFKDAMIRFSKNKTNVVATTILFIIIAGTILIPIFSSKNASDLEAELAFLPPRVPIVENWGFLDGTSHKDGIPVDPTTNLPIDYVEDVIVMDSLVTYEVECTDRSELCVGGTNVLSVDAGATSAAVVGENYMTLVKANDPTITVVIDEFINNNNSTVHIQIKPNFNDPFTTVASTTEAGTIEIKPFDLYPNAGGGWPMATPVRIVLESTSNKDKVAITSIAAYDSTQTDPIFFEDGYLLSQYSIDTSDGGAGLYVRSTGQMLMADFTYRNYVAALGNQQRTIPASEYNEIIAANPDVCVATANGADSEYPDGWSFPAECPIQEVYSQSEPVTVDGEEYYSYDLILNYQLYKGYEEMPYFLFGTDFNGRDLFTLLWIATRTSLLIGLVVAAINVSIGVVYGAISGYYGGAVDLILQRITEVIGRIPWLVTLSIFVSFFGPGIQTLILILIVSGWIGPQAVTRTQFYRYKGREYVLASRTLGAKDSRLIFRHILPNGIGTIITSSILMIPYTIFSESTISYLGFGVGHGQEFNVLGISFSGVSVGVLLSDGRNYLLDRPYLTVFPAILISILMITFNMFGNALRDAFNPALRGSE